jgi:phosphoribosyl 1,2-cyclic phosphodiesterase
MKITFWGVRGSVPSPITGAQLERKMLRMLLKSMANPPKTGSGRPEDEVATEWMQRELSFSERATFGGNTTCVEVRCGDVPIILDMGTGLRELGIRQMQELFSTGKLEGHILQSHVHWDHIQGVPFWKPLYAPRRKFPDCRFTFYGGKEWELDLQAALRQQMQGQVFPVQFEEIRRVGMTMGFETVFDMWSAELGTKDGSAKVLARKLHHPQETFGYRLSHGGKTLAFTTDHEPYAEGVPRGLLELVEGVDVWVTDCQYTLHEYLGQVGGVQKLGWGHSFPEYIARVAKLAKPGLVVTTHHDPEASDEAIEEIAKAVETESGIRTYAAHEGLVLDV